MNADDLAKILDELGKRLGPTGSHVYELAVRQVIIDGVFNTIITAVCILLSIGIIYWAKKFKASEDAKKANDRHYFSDWPLGGVVAAIIVICLSLIALMTGYTAINCLLNPEYQVIKNLIYAIHP